MIMMPTTAKARADAVRAAAASCASCSAATVATLKDLLGLDADALPSSGPAGAKAKTSATKNSAAKTKAVAGSRKQHQSGGGQLAGPEQERLAVDIINLALKALQVHANPPPPQPPQPSQSPPQPSTPPTPPPEPAGSQTTTDDEAPPRRRPRALRRSTSAPLSPVKAQSPNRSSTLPSNGGAGGEEGGGGPGATGPSADGFPPPSPACLATVQCARVALSAVKSLADQGRSRITRPQLEMACLSFVDRLLRVGLLDQAAREMILLKRWLSRDPADKQSRSIATVFDLSSVDLSGHRLGLAISLHFYALQLMVHARRPADIVEALPFLRPEWPTSPLALLLRIAAKPGDGGAAGWDLAKTLARLHTLSKILPALGPSLSSEDDATAREPRLSPSPECALELQCLGLGAKLHHWRLSRTEKDAERDVDREIMAPLAGCLRALFRRTHRSASAYGAAAAAFRRLTAAAEARGLTPDKASPQSPFAAILLSLAAAAAPIGLHEDAVRWEGMWKAIVDLDGADSTAAKRCLASARLLAAHLRRATFDDPDQLEGLIRDTLDGLQGSLTGSTAELDDLLGALQVLRNAVLRILYAASPPAEEDDQAPVPETCRDLLECLMLYYARFTKRWLGSPPAGDPATREFVRYEQRRHLLVGSLGHTIDTVLRVAKDRLDGARLGFDHLDETLQDCIAVLADMDDVLAGTGSDRKQHHVRISTLYAIMFQQLCKAASLAPASAPAQPTKPALRSLSRAIDAVLGRSAQEKQQANLTARLERFANLCLSAGRVGDAQEALRSMCTEMVGLGRMEEDEEEVDDDGSENVLLRVTAELERGTHPALAWKLDGEVEMLSRALCSLAKIDDAAWRDRWAGGLPGHQRAAVFEHAVHFTGATTVTTTPYTGGATGRAPETCWVDSSADALLFLYPINRFPVRRLRTLVHLYAVNAGDGGQTDLIRPLVEAALERTDTAEDEYPQLGDDTHLGRLVPHLRGCFASVDSLVRADDNWPPQSVRDAVAAWTAMVVDRTTATAIDYPAGLSSHLRALADFASMRGESMLLLAVLELGANIARLPRDPRPDSADSADSNLMVLSHSALAARYVDLGYAHKAGEVLERIRLVIQRAGGDVTRTAAARYHLSCAELLLSSGKIDKAEQAVSQAKDALVSDGATLDMISRPQRAALISLASCLLAKAALEKGELHQALSYTRHGTHLLIAHWSNLEQRGVVPMQSSSPPRSRSRSRSRSRKSSVGAVGMAYDSVPYVSVPAQPCGPEFWSLAHPLLQGLGQMSTLYGHLGLFRETVYYAERAYAVAELTRSRLYRSQVAAWLGRIWIKADRPGRAVGFAGLAKDLLPTAAEPTAELVTLAVELSDMCRELGEFESESALLDLAETSTRALEAGRGERLMVPQLHPTSTASPAEIGTKKTLPIRSRARARTAAGSSSSRRKGAAPAAAAATTAAATALSIVVDGGRGGIAPANARQAPLLASILIHKALSLIQRRDWDAALALLHEARSLPKHASVLTREQVTAAVCLISQSTELMIQDPVFSVIPDSAISFPSAMAGAATATSPYNPPPPPSRRRRAAAAAAAAAAATDVPNFSETLRRAQEYLLESHAVAMAGGDGGLVNRIATLLQGTSILLSAIAPAAFQSLGCAAYATCSVELARNVIWRREGRSLLAEKASSPSSATSSLPFTWPTPPASPAAGPAGRPSLAMAGGGVAADMAQFQRDYVEVIPRPWTVISMSLTDGGRDLCITKLQAVDRHHHGSGPLVIRIPLVRESGGGGGGGGTDGHEDGDSGEDRSFGFRAGLAEMETIIRLANDTSHTGSSTRERNEIKAWWDQRRALDDRLRSLLDRIEVNWLCGFRGIFSQHRRREDLLPRFRTSLHGILDKHLPSRRSSRRGGGSASAAAKKKKAAAAAPTPVMLDSRILDLFIGLGDPDGPGSAVELHDALEDLLYFVVDVLQFNGERNAYDEIDFDAMVVDAQDALRAYHAAAASAAADDPSASPRRAEGAAEEGGAAHTILVLDKALHAFPWESLPCLRGLPVSRVPSLAYLGRLIRERRRPAAPTSESSPANRAPPPPPGHFVSAASGTYILNPSSDLKNTLASFDRPFATTLDSRPDWTGIVSRPPTEAEFESALASRDVLLYFGHGSGAQYIRARTLRRLDKCRAVALLMGCSSASLPCAGEFECYGPARNYMLAGCPAVVGTLWDVTDKDIDRYAAVVLADWGLVPEIYQPSGRSRSDLAAKRHPQRKSPSQSGGRGTTSLVEAVAAARDVCKLQYLNGAAVCVYGIPVYLDPEG